MTTNTITSELIEASKALKPNTEVLNKLAAVFPKEEVLKLGQIDFAIFCVKTMVSEMGVEIEKAYDTVFFEGAWEQLLTNLKAYFENN